jgi:hypothetical protein
MTDWMRDEQPGVRDLARAGELVAHFHAAMDEERRRLRIEAYELLHVVVFTRLTRPVEMRRRHGDCAVSVNNLRPDCLDRFHDDMDAVLDDLFRNARKPIYNLEGWVTRRLAAVTIDAYRRRRGERGALQRPRLPKWLVQEFRRSKRLTELAIKMLEWVGVEASAGVHDWPIEVWAAQRVEAGTIDGESAERTVARDIAIVLTAMRKRPRWYAAYIDRPMGRKRLPLAWTYHDDAEPTPDPAQADRDAQADDARRNELAALAVATIGARLERGEDIRPLVIDVISAVFGAGTGSENMDRFPGQDNADDERVKARLADPKTVDRIVEVVLELLSS